ncbi:MAG: hypothetical protein NZ899_09780 [Thermoguttaceae bacterium]|nr:hypothetical protein [Thermoguttaceae bacterium]MDW8077580.1 hypothetical protein [Thermoguttaceae bacterium]
MKEPVADVYEWLACRPDFRQQTAFFYQFYQQAAKRYTSVGEPFTWARRAIKPLWPGSTGTSGGLRLEAFRTSVE